ncbi:Phosphate import ATP-binding protein pstB [Bacillus cereus Rock3-42]|nr:Phosphate import ATP-binding protein pstB [Bacillus cereus Rock3-42]
MDERGIQMVATVVNVQVKNEEKIETAPKKVVFDTKNLNLWYGEDHALKDINLSIHENEVTAIIGPSGCGKSTYLKTLNRMVELVPIVRTTGVIEYRERNIFDKSYPVEELRTHVGMVFQKTKSISKIYL